MRKYASMLAVTGGLALATSACSGQVPDEAACMTCAAATCTSCEGCEGCGSCESCGSCATCSACEGSGPGVTATMNIPGAIERPPPRPELDIPAYPNWPPEEASTRVDIGDMIPNQTGLSLYDAGQRLRAALDLADYPDHSFYSVPGGFMLVTQREQIDPAGRTMPGTARFAQPGEGRADSLLTRIRDLFLERPPSYYRYLAIVITDRPFGASDTALSAADATDLVQQGSTALSRDARDIAFDDEFLAIALIYEYTNSGVGSDLTMIEPGRIGANDHLDLTGLSDAIPRAFEQRGAN